MTAIATTFFDTHESVKELISAGFTEKQAEKQVKIQFQTFLTLQKEQVTIKENLHSLKVTTNEIKADVDGLKTDVSNLKTDVGNLKVDVGNLKTDVNQLRTDMNYRFMRVEDEMRHLETRLETKFTGKFNLLYWMMGGLFTTLSPLVANEIHQLYILIFHWQ